MECYVMWCTYIKYFSLLNWILRTVDGYFSVHSADVSLISLVLRGSCCHADCSGGQIELTAVSYCVWNVWHRVPVAVYWWHVSVSTLRSSQIRYFPLTIRSFILSISLHVCCMTFNRTDKVIYITSIIYGFYTILLLLYQLRVRQINHLNEPFWECIIGSL